MRELVRTIVDSFFADNYTVPFHLQCREIVLKREKFYWHCVQDCRVYDFIINKETPVEAFFYELRKTTPVTASIYMYLIRKDYQATAKVITKYFFISHGQSR